MTPLQTAPLRGSRRSGWRNCAAALALLPCACSSESEAGVHVELMSERSVVAGADLAAGSGMLRVTELRWTSTEIELLGCPSALGAVQSWLLPAAHAHGTSTPTLSAVPIVINGVGADAELNTTRIGNLQPPAGRYCSLRYRLGPADADALGLALAPNLRERSFWLRGAAGPSAAELVDFELFSERVLDVSLPLELELSRERPEVTVQFRLDPQRWLAGLDASALVSPESGAGALLDAFAAGLTVRVE